jgi:ketosteroid isomerase-like protein
MDRMAEPFTERFINALQHAERTGELDPLLALFHDDAAALNLGRTEPAEGREGLREFWGAYLSAFREIRSEFTHVIEGDEGSVLEWISRGTLPDGSPLEYRGVSVLETDGDRVRRFRTYYDSAVFLPQGARG